MSTAEIKQKIKPILEQHGVEYAAIFGSAARGEEKPDSDIDIVCKFRGPATFSAYLSLDNALRHALGKDIDLLTEGSVNKLLRPYIEKDLQIVYGQRPAVSISS